MDSIPEGSIWSKWLKFNTQDLKPDTCLGFWILHHGYRIFSTVFRILCVIGTCIPDSDRGFRIPWAVFRFPKSRIPRIPWQKFPGFRHRSRLHMGRGYDRPSIFYEAEYSGSLAFIWDYFLKVCRLLETSQHSQRILQTDLVTNCISFSNLMFNLHHMCAI